MLGGCNAHQSFPADSILHRSRTIGQNDCVRDLAPFWQRPAQIRWWEWGDCRGCVAATGIERLPSRSSRRVEIEQDRTLYKQRNRIERMFGYPKVNRAIATRYDLLANSFLGMIHIATARYGLKFVHATLFVSLHL